jgi:16S rRNA (cytidine1402-2'-O)-methyltransferase
MADQRTNVVLEAPSRVVATLGELAALDGARPVAVVRELTKVYEEVWRGTMAEATTVFAARGVRGEVVLVIGGAPPPAPASAGDIDDAVRRRLAQGDGPRQAAAAVAGELGVARRTIYETALRLRAEERVPPV